MPAPATAVDQQVIWKNDEMLRFAVSLVRHAVQLSHRGILKFTTDIVPDAERRDGHGVAGSVTTMLKNAHVLEAVGIFSNSLFYAERAKSERTQSKGRWLNVYRLVSLGIAEEFLRRNDGAFVQKELNLTAA